MNPFGVQEMNAQEIRESNGGSVDPFSLGLGIVALVTYLVDNWDSVKEGFNEGRDDVKEAAN